MCDVWFASLSVAFAGYVASLLWTSLDVKGLFLRRGVTFLGACCQWRRLIIVLRVTVVGGAFSVRACIHPLGINKKPVTFFPADEQTHASVLS